MNLSKYATMDVNLLLGLVNTGLRNDAEDLEDFVKMHGMDKEVLEARLAGIGYRYNEGEGQFRANED